MSVVCDECENHICIEHPEKCNPNMTLKEKLEATKGRKFEIFKCGNGHTYYVPEKSCTVCKHLTDIFWDYTNGPYAFICDKKNDDDIEKGLAGNCDGWEKEEGDDEEADS